MELVNLEIALCLYVMHFFSLCYKVCHVFLIFFVNVTWILLFFPFIFSLSNSLKHNNNNWLKQSKLSLLLVRHQVIPNSCSFLFIGSLLVHVIDFFSKSYDLIMIISSMPFKLVWLNWCLLLILIPKFSDFRPW